jgi:hypothetical protein
MGEDWRLQGQERYLQGAALRWARWWPIHEGWDHDHCEFCWVHFCDDPLDEPDTQVEGYVTEDDCHWICRSCFDDFKDRFGFHLRGDRATQATSDP